MQNKTIIITELHLKMGQKYCHKCVGTYSTKTTFEKIEKRTAI